MNFPIELQRAINPVLLNVVRQRIQGAIATTNANNPNELRKAASYCIAPLNGRCHRAVLCSVKSHVLEQFTQSNHKNCQG